MVISKMSRIPQIKIANEEIKQETVFKYLRCLFTEDMCCDQEVKCRIALVKEALIRKKRLLCRSLHIKLKRVW